MSREITIMHVVGPAAGGIKSHLEDLVGNSRGNGFRHLTACPPGALADSLEGMGTEVFRVPLEGRFSPARDLAAVRLVASLLKRARPDILHAHSSKAGLVGRVAARMAGVPAVLLTVHGSIFHRQHPRWQEGLLAFSERALAGVTDMIITVSEALGREIAHREKIDPEKIVTVYNGVVPEKFSRGPDREYFGKVTGIPAGCRVVGTVARLAPQKGVAGFIRAAALVAKDSGDTAFLVVGDGPLRAGLEQLARDLGLAGRIFFAGERPDVDSIMPCLDVFVLASLTEGLPLSVLEALAARRPVVATRVGGIPEVIRHGVNGLLVDPGDITGLAGSIRVALGDPEGSRAMGERGRETVLERFTVAGMVSRTEMIYANLVERMLI